MVNPVNPGGFSDRLPGPGAGMYIPRGDFGSGSMLLGPNDPLWSRGVGEPDSFGGLPIVYPPVNPGGFRDLLPGPGARMYLPRRDYGSGSMLVGPNDPLWSRGVGEPDSFGGLPVVPQGARYDPIGPPGVPGFEPNRFVRYARRPGRWTHPDVQHFHSDEFISRYSQRPGRGTHPDV